jgi:hypothetical protein
MSEGAVGFLVLVASSIGSALLVHAFDRNLLRAATLPSSFLCPLLPVRPLCIVRIRVRSRRTRRRDG